jgi:hypothetical protein
VRVGIPSLRKKVVDLPCEVSYELKYFQLCVCVDPLRLGGIRGKKITPSVCWEVLRKSLQLTSGRQKEAQVQKRIFKFSVFGYGNLS